MHSAYSREAADRPASSVSRLTMALFPPRLVGRYVAVGATSAVLEIGLFYSLITWFSFPLMASNVMAVCTVTIAGFFGQKHFTFRAAGSIRPQAALYVCQVSLNFLLNNGLVFLFAQVLQWNPVLSKVLQLGLCFVFNFSFSRFVVFSALRKRIEHAA